ncbi:hypothetical protein [Lutibacter sp.]
MKKLLIFLTLGIGIQSYSQIISGKLFIINSSNERKIDKTNFENTTIYIENKVSEKESESFEIIRVNSNGTFSFDTSKLKRENLNLIFIGKSCFATILKNIPKSKVNEFLKVVPIANELVDKESIRAIIYENVIEYNRKKYNRKKKKNEPLLNLINTEYYYEYEYRIN